MKNTNTVVKLLLVLLAALILFALLTYYNRSKERFNVAQPGAPLDMAPLTSSKPSRKTPPQAVSSPSLSATFADPIPSESAKYEKHMPVGLQKDGGSAPRDPYPQDKVSPHDLLPKNAANSKWAQVNPAGQGDVANGNFLTAGYHMGTNTTGQSLRNASHDLRSEPSNPRYKVSIWNNATIESDLSRRPLE